MFHHTGQSEQSSLGFSVQLEDILAEAVTEHVGYLFTLLSTGRADALCLSIVFTFSLQRVHSFEELFAVFTNFHKHINGFSWLHPSSKLH